MITQDNFLKKSLKDSNIKSLGELITFNSTKNKDNSNITILSVNNTKGIIPQEEQFLDRRVASKNTSNYKIVKKGDFVFNPSRINVGSIGQLLDFEIGIVSPLYTCFSCNTELLSKFFKYYTQSNTFKNQIKSKLEGSVRNSLSEKGLAEVLIKLPSMYYQQKIADFLSTVDEKIENQKEIVANWEEIKKGLIQKIFSQEIRFKDKNGQDYSEWENYPLHKLSKLYQPKTIQESSFSTTGFSVYGANGIIGFYPQYNHETRQIAMACRGNSCGTINFTKEFSWITGNAMVINTDGYEDIIVKTFLMHQLKHSNLKYLITGGGQPQITREHLKTHTVKVPTTLEQQKIADFLSTIDEKIDCEKNILNELTELKKGLLQRIFA